jgi:OOP family OmpA-OmpF porin
MRALVLVTLLTLLAASAHAQNGAAVLSGERIELRTPITFDTGTPNVTAEGQQILDEVVRILRMHPEIAIDIGVHSDSSGSSAFNQAQTEARAHAIRIYLTTHGIAARRIQAQGFGETHPIDSNSTAEGRAHNRRVEIAVRRIGP